MVPDALSKRIHGVVGLMIIYGHSGQDIRRAIWRRRYKFILAFAVIVSVVLLTGCGTAENKKIELKALDQFWDALAGKNSTGVE